VTHPWSDGVSRSSINRRRGCATVDGYAAQQAEAAKHRYYTPHLPGNTHFLPFAIETFGRFGQDARHAMTLIARETGIRRHWPKWYFYYHHVPRISLAVAEGNQMAVDDWMSMHAMRLQHGRAAPGPDEDAILDHGPELVDPRASRRLRGSMRRILRVDGDRRAFAERRREALAVPEAEQLPVDDIGREVVPYEAEEEGSG
jgi:hypothetical protein